MPECGLSVQTADSIQKPLINYTDVLAGRRKCYFLLLSCLMLVDISGTSGSLRKKNQYLPKSFSLLFFFFSQPQTLTLPLLSNPVLVYRLANANESTRIIKNVWIFLTVIYGATYAADDLCSEEKANTLIKENQVKSEHLASTLYSAFH